MLFKKLVVTHDIDFVSHLWVTNPSLENATLAGYDSFIFYLKAACQRSLCNCLQPPIRLTAIAVNEGSPKKSDPMTLSAFAIGPVWVVGIQRNVTVWCDKIRDGLSTGAVGTGGRVTEPGLGKGARVWV